MATLSNIDLRLLRVFVAVTEHGGYSAAQSELNIGLSTISSHMSALEERLGARLCERGRGGFRLTDKGTAAYEETKRLFAAIGEFDSAMSSLQGRVTGVLNIGMVDHVLGDPEFVLDEVVRRFNQRENTVHINLRVAPRQDLEQAVLTDDAHLAIAPFVRKIDGLRFRPLFRERLEVYCGAGHPLFSRTDRTVARADLDGCAIVARRYLHDQDRERMGRVRVRATVDNMEALATLILSGGYLGYLPTWYAEDWVREKRLKALPVKDLGYESKFMLITRSGKNASTALDLFIEDFEAVVKERSKGGAVIGISSSRHR